MRRTDKYQLPYLEEGDTTLPTIETQRWETVDTQLYSLFAILGNGIIEGWNLTASDGLGVIISAGKGHVNYVAVESQQSVAILSLTANTRNHIYATLTESSFWLQSVTFQALLTETSSSRMVYLGYVDTDATSVTLINTDVRNEIGYISEIRTLISEHQHIGGTEDPEPVDLGSEVQNKLDANNMPELDASRITGGELDASVIPDLDHITKLINNGVLTHAQLDSFVSSLSQNNASLMGSISSSNFLKVLIHLMHTDSTVDNDQLNERTIIAGVTSASYVDFVNTNAGITYDTVERTISASPTGTPLRFYTETIDVSDDLKSFIITHENDINFGAYQESTSSIDSTSSNSRSESSTDSSSLESDSTGGAEVKFYVSRFDTANKNYYREVDLHTITDISDLISNGKLKVMIEFNGDDGTLITLGGFAFMFSTEGSPSILS